MARAPEKRPDRNQLRRSFVTPEGVDLRIELGSAGARAGAFMLDLLFMLIILIVAGVVIGLTAFATRSILLAGLGLVGFFFLRNGWFALFEMGGRGATPGKRIVGLRVIARDGSRLTGGAVIARNAMREIEFFLPVTFFFATIHQAGTDKMIALASLVWTGIFLFFPLFNRDRLRVGDLLAGTWVVQRARMTLGHDIVASIAASDQPRRSFSDHALSLYGEYELQTLEEVLRGGDNDAIATVAAAIRRKAALPDEYDDYGFLSDYYAALCARLERQMMVGMRRADKYADASRRAA